jgi:hypothetical protein
MLGWACLPSLTQTMMVKGSNRMTDFDTLLHRYLDDRSGLTADELDELIAGLRDDHELAGSLREQLMLDELLAQKMSVDRRNFEAQVEQRIADLAKTKNPLGDQVADLSSLAAAEKVQKASSHVATWYRYLLALSLLVGVGGSWYVLRPGSHQAAIATITEVSGQVTIHQDDESTPAEVEGAIEDGQKIVVPHGDSVAFTYQDGTEIRIKGEATVSLGDDETKGGKQIQVERGEVVARVKPQVAGPIRFRTPHAVAMAPKSQLRLVVSDEHTLLDVSEGHVPFHRIADKQMLTIDANKSGLASRDTLQIRQLTWPDRRDGLAYLYSSLEQANEKPLMVSRNPETRLLGFKELQPYGDATLLESRLVYELNGGYLYSSEAGPDVSAFSRNGSELTLEAIICTASLDQAGPARIVALADEEDDPDFALAQDGCDVTFSLRTNEKQPSSSPRLVINSSETPVHLTVTYRHGELIFYRDGMEIARSKDLLGSLKWRSGPLTVGADASGKNPWRGIMEAFALYNRCLEPGEVARNARNYRLLVGRGM